MYLQNPSQACPTFPSGSTSWFEGGLEQCDESQNLKNQELVSSVLSKLHVLNLGEDSE